MNKLLLFLFLSGIGNPFLFSQNTFRLKINPMFGAEKLQLESWYKLSDQDSVVIESLRFYLSGFELTRGGTSIWKENESYHLIDPEDPASCQISLNFAKNTDFDGIRFYLGIDSLTNSGGVKGGDLDPVKGMYWTWQTGYVHFKLEGKSNLCPTRNQQFSLHLGGYSFPQNTLQVLDFKLTDLQAASLDLDLKNFLDGTGLQSTNHIMSPGPEAVKLSRQLAVLFQLK
ncbi:MAG: MbnP family protein [Bacteroidota bacterium]